MGGSSANISFDTKERGWLSARVSLMLLLVEKLSLPGKLYHFLMVQPRPKNQSSITMNGLKIGMK